MIFKVILTEPAYLDLENVVDVIAVRSATAARQWLVDFWKAVDSLHEFPLRHPVIAEGADLGIPYRSLLHHSHRIIYRIAEDEGRIYIVRIYHGARRPLSLDEVH